MAAALLGKPIVLEALIVELPSSSSPSSSSSLSSDAPPPPTAAVRLFLPAFPFVDEDQLCVPFHALGADCRYLSNTHPDAPQIMGRVDAMT